MIQLNYRWSIQDSSELFWHFFKLSLDKDTYNCAREIIQACAILIFALMLGNAGNTFAGETMILSENDSGKMVEICVGGDLEIVLPGNPTSGYVWEVISFDSVILRLGKTYYFASDKAIGSGGMEVIKFHTIAAGTSEVSLIFHRPFEQNIPPLKTFAVTVTVKK